MCSQAMDDEKKASLYLLSGSCHGLFGSLGHFTFSFFSPFLNTIEMEYLLLRNHFTGNLGKFVLLSRKRLSVLMLPGGPQKQAFRSRCNWGLCCCLWPSVILWSHGITRRGIRGPCWAGSDLYCMLQQERWFWPSWENCLPELRRDGPTPQHWQGRVDPHAWGWGSWLCPSREGCRTQWSGLTNSTMNQGYVWGWPKHDPQQQGLGWCPGSR